MAAMPNICPDCSSDNVRAGSYRDYIDLGNSVMVYEIVCMDCGAANEVDDPVDAPRFDRSDQAILETLPSDDFRKGLIEQESGFHEFKTERHSPSESPGLKGPGETERLGPKGNQQARRGLEWST